MKRSWIWAIGLVVTLVWVNLAAAQEQPKRPAPPRLPEGVKVLRDLLYVAGGHERNRLDLYLPEKAEGRLPLVVWIHGGGWQGGNKENCPAVPFATRGYAVASINYRLSQHAVFPAQIEDCKAAIRWLRANAAKYHFDADHIGVWGESAGGHLVALLGTTGGVKDLEGSGGNLDQSSRVQCVVDWFGPTDFVGWDPNFNKAVYPMIAHLLGGLVQENKEKARKASPLIGDWDQRQAMGLNASRGIALNGYHKVVFEHLHLEGIRQMGLTAGYCDEVSAHGCTIERNARDGMNFTGSRFVTVSGCTIRHCYDDAVAVHCVHEDTNPAAKYGTVISGNQIEDSFGIKVLGGENIIISHNNIMRPKLYGVYLGKDSHYQEGLVPHRNVIIQGNLITDVIRREYLQVPHELNEGIVFVDSGRAIHGTLVVNNVITKSKPSGPGVRLAHV